MLSICRCVCARIAVFLTALTFMFLILPFLTLFCVPFEAEVFHCVFYYVSNEENNNSRLKAPKLYMFGKFGGHVWEVVGMLLGHVWDMFRSFGRLFGEAFG